MRPANLLIGAGTWLIIGGVIGALSNTPIPAPAEPAPPPAAAGASLPTSVRIPDQDVTAPVEPVGTGDRGSLALPVASRVGWWIGGATPTDARGTVVLAGHLDDRTGPGALHAAGDLRPGMRIEVSSGRTTTVYAVVAVSRYPKQALPRSLFTTQGPRRLALITCGGPFDHATGHYRDNVVVLAEPQ